jgi:prepilin-type N-terminal cleavage/methylation domain-containing protein
VNSGLAAGARARRGFTIIEVLIVSAIIAVLAGMTLGVTVMVKERARALATESRIQTVLNGLTQYGAATGSPAVALQTNFSLGGVTAFAPIKAINDSLAAGCQKPAGFVQWTFYPNQPQYGNPSTVGRATFDATNYTANIERTTLWRRLIDEVTDVMPPAGAVWSIADYSNPANGGWPTQWPETDWDLGAPGTNPPMLRFPWGKPGLRIDGSLCDPNQDDSATLGTFAEFQTSTGHRVTGLNPDYTKNPSEPIVNRWATLGPSGGRIWQWNNTPGGSGQTDAIQLTQANRSDGSTADITSPKNNANRAMPFDMGWMSPLKTIQLMQAAGVLRPDDVGAEEYRKNRKNSSAWNDAWGHPLIVVYAMFQPERYFRAFDNDNRRDLLLKAASKAYQYNRSLYFAVGASGPVLDPITEPDTWDYTSDTTVLRDYWKAVRWCAHAEKWTEESFTAPPWKGIYVNSEKIPTGKMKCFLSAPIEVK